jgi:hypothetical protein
MKIDENEITEDELLSLPDPKPVEESVKTLRVAATAAISHAAINSSTMDELEIEECKKLIKALYRGTKFSSITAKVKIYAFTCSVRGITFPNLNKPTRLDMYTRLSEEVCAQHCILHLLISQ